MPKLLEGVGQLGIHLRIKVALYTFFSHCGFDFRIQILPSVSLLLTSESVTMKAGLSYLLPTSGLRVSDYSSRIFILSHVPVTLKINI